MIATSAPARRRPAVLFTALALMLAAAACAPIKYVEPAAPLVPAYKENADWKQAEPRDTVLRGAWWELFGDPELDALEARIAVSNETLKAFAAQFAQARAAVRGVRAARYPQVTLAPSIGLAQPSADRATSSFHNAYADFVLPVDASYEADVWGRIRNAVNASERTAQASAADLETVSLSLHAELAEDYFALRGLDRLRELLDSTVAAYAQALQLTENRFTGGVASQADVALAETQLESTRAQAADIEVSRAALEHAIAELIGQAPSAFSITRAPLETTPPIVPVGVPTALLERRPDIAASERRVAAANAQVGVATSALYPLLTLSGSAGFESSSFGSWLATASHFWSIAPAAAVNLFDAGRRRAVTAQAQAAYEQASALYRESVLTAFHEVEDQLAALRVLDEEAAIQARAVAAAERALALATNRYRGGVVTYLEVITAQGAALANERAAVNVLMRRMSASVLLMKALGGGWDRAQLPSPAATSRD